jgi:hypothetical protein
MALIKCPECGKQISDKAATCPNCGIDVQKAFMPSPQHLYQPNSVVPETFIKTRRAPFGIVALILSIVSYILLLIMVMGISTGRSELSLIIVFVLYASILGLVFSIIGLTIVKRNRQAYTHKPMLVISLVLCIVSIIISALLIPQIAS